MVGVVWYAWYGMVGLVHLTRPNATKILVGADGHGREAQTNVAPPSFFSEDDLFKLFIESCQ